jgi:hypothetical protein
MYKTFTQRLSITKLGKRDDIVKEYGKNNKDGWTFTVKPDEGRFPVLTLKKSK